MRVAISGSWCASVGGLSSQAASDSRHVRQLSPSSSPHSPSQQVQWTRMTHWGHSTIRQIAYLQEQRHMLKCAMSGWGWGGGGVVVRRVRFWHLLASSDNGNKGARLESLFNICQRREKHVYNRRPKELLFLVLSWPNSRQQSDIAARAGWAQGRVYGISRYNTGASVGRRLRR